jgi:hypothetical protein
VVAKRLPILMFGRNAKPVDGSNISRKHRNHCYDEIKCHRSPFFPGLAFPDCAIWALFTPERVDRRDGRGASSWNDGGDESAERERDRSNGERERVPGGDGI